MPSLAELFRRVERDPPFGHSGEDHSHAPLNPTGLQSSCRGPQGAAIGLLKLLDEADATFDCHSRPFSTAASAGQRSTAVRDAIAHRPCREGLEHARDSTEAREEPGERPLSGSAFSRHGGVPFDGGILVGVYSWPLKPFDRAHAVRGYFNDPRISGKSRAFHFGIDIAAPNGAPVYAVRTGVVHLEGKRSLSVADGPLVASAFRRAPPWGTPRSAAAGGARPVA